MAMRINAELEIRASDPAWGPGRAPIPGEAATVRVTARDIATGERCHCCKCPVALAMSRLWPGVTVAVTTDTVYLYDSADDYEDQTAEPGEVWSHDAFDFVEAFDDRRDVKPCAVRVQLLQRLS
jgi:hypothetical protein